MSRPELTELIATNLHAMPHEDGRPRRMMHFSQFAGGSNADPKVQAAVKQIAVDHGDSIQHLMERHGYQVTHKDDPKPADTDGYKSNALKCLKCGKELLSLGVSADMTSTLGRMALKSIAETFREHVESCYT